MNTPKMFQNTEAYLKAEFDVEKELLDSTVKLTDGTQGKLFSRGLRGPTDDIFIYHCHLCHVVNMVGEQNFKVHIAGRKHRNLLNGAINATKFNIPLFKDPKLNAEANLGDPLAAMRKDIQPDVDFQANLEASNQPMVGLEYIFELRDLKSAPSFTCILCNSNGNTAQILMHLVNQVHRINYLQKHFPSLLHTVWSCPEFQNNMIKREKELEDVCQRVEKIIGRSEIQINDFKNFDFNAKGHNVKGNVKALGRATKLNITQLILSSDDSELEYVDEEPEENFKKKKTRSRSPCRWSSERERERERLRMMSPELKKPRRLIPKPTINASKLYIERYKRDEFRFRMETILFELELKHRAYKLNLQRHPNYSEQWLIYWNKNKVDIKRDHIDKNSVKEDWCKVFLPIMEKMHHDQIVRIKLEYKKKLKLAPKSSIFKKRYERLTTRRDKSPFVISDDEDYEENPTKRIRVDPPAGDPSTSAQATCTVSSDSSDDEDDDDTSPNVAFYEKYCPKTMAAKLEPTPAPDNDATTLKTVCRLLIDFDIYLGHLPSFILLIFAQCLFLEKKDLHSVDEILLTQYNCDILNKVMQGMERKIATKKMPVKKVKAAKRLIIKISMLLKKGDAMRKGKALPDPQQPEHPVVSTNPFECYEGTDYELLDLSDRITVGLASKGNTLITKDDVAELINNFKKCYQLNNDDNNDDEDPDEDEVNTEPEVRARDYTKSPLPQVKSPEVIKDDRIAYFIQQVRAQCAGQNTDFTDNNLHELTQKFKTLPRKIQNHLLSYIKEIKDEDITKITTLNKFENMAPVEIQVQQLTVAPEEIPRSANHTPLEHEHLDLAPEALQVEELVEEIMQFENFADDLLRGDDDGQGSDDDTSEVEVIENERPEPVDVDDSDDNALDVEDSDEEVVEHGDELDEEAFMASDEELDDGAVDNPDEQEAEASDADEDSNAEIKDSDEDSDTDMDDEADDSDSDQMDADDDADDDSDMDDDDNDMNDDSDDGEDHEPTHQPEDEQDDESEEEEAEEQPDEPTVEQAEQPAGNQDEQPAVDQAPQVKEASKDSGEESDDDQPKESNRNYEYDSNDDGYDDAEVIAKMINLTTFEGPPKPQSFAMPLPSTSAPPKSLLYSLQKNMKKAFNAPQSSKDFFNGCQLQCNKETAKKLNYPYQNLTPIFRCKKPRFEELKPNMFNASIDNAQFKANDMYLHQLHANNDEVQDTGVKRANKRR